MKQEKLDPEKAGGWSQFVEWAGMNWFQNGPVTPPQCCENNTPKPKKEEKYGN